MNMRVDPPVEISADASKVDQVAALIGPEAWGRLQTDFGGRRLYVPEKPGEHHPLAVSIGLELAQRLGRHFSQEYLEIPLALKKRTLIARMLAQGVSPAEIARALHCTRRHVYAVKSEIEAEGGSPQKDFFA